MASPATIAAVVDTVMQTTSKIPCSVALGELLELPKIAPSLPDAVRWLKMGLSGCRHHPDWRERWSRARETIRPHAAWIAVAYVDADAAGAPSIGKVLDAAIETRCSGLLLDTFSKTSGTLLDAVSLDELHKVTRTAQAAGLLVALAGRLRRCDLPTVLAVNPDVVAVRSAVCRGENRTSVMEESLVREFHAAMLDTV